MILITLSRAKPSDFPEIIKMVSAVVTGRFADGVPYQKDNGSFVLDRANDWFASFIIVGETTTLRVTYRYEHDGNAEALEGLAEFLKWKLTRHSSY